MLLDTSPSFDTDILLRLRAKDKGIIPLYLDCLSGQTFSWKFLGLICHPQKILLFLKNTVQNTCMVPAAMDYITLNWKKNSERISFLFVFCRGSYQTAFGQRWSTQRTSCFKRLFKDSSFCPQQNVSEFKDFMAPSLPGISALLLSALYHAMQGKCQHGAWNCVFWLINSV